MTEENPKITVELRKVHGMILGAHGRSNHWIVMGGTVYGAGQGTMIPEIINFILVSEDQIAINAIGPKMMGFDPMAIKRIIFAQYQRLGCGDIINVGKFKKSEWG